MYSCFCNFAEQAESRAVLTNPVGAVGQKPGHAFLTLNPLLLVFIMFVVLCRSSCCRGEKLLDKRRIILFTEIMVCFLLASTTNDESWTKQMLIGLPSSVESTARFSALYNRKVFIRS